MKNKTKLAFDLLEQEMEVICKEEQVRFTVGSGGFTYEQLVAALNSGDLSSIPAGSYIMNSENSFSYWEGSLNEVVVFNKRMNSSSGGYSSGGGFSSGSSWDWTDSTTGTSGSVWLNSDYFGGGGSTGGGTGSSSYPVSDLYSASAFAGYTGLYLEKTASLLHYTAQEATALADIANALRATKILVIAGKSIGVVGSVFTGYEGATDADGFTWGDGVKVGIGLVTTFTPYGWAYGVVDLATGVITGTTLTDALGNAIDGN